MIFEGLIKLPPALYQELEKFVLNWYLAHVYAVVERKHSFDENTLDTAHRLIATACARYGVTPTATDIRIARNKFSFQKTFTLDEKVYNTSVYMKVVLELVLEQSKTKNLGSYEDETGFIILSAHNLHMTSRSLATTSSLRYSLGKIDELLSYLKHELTHLVQLRILANKHHEQVAAAYSAESDFDDSYALSQLEFDPLIKSELGVLSKLKAKYRLTPGYNGRALQDAFICVAKPPSWMLPDDQSVFFEVLKRRAPSRWRKAVRLFMSET